MFERPDSTLSRQWNEWGIRHLRDGDVIFILGQSRLVMGLINFSEFSSDIAASRFSHVGIVSIEDQQPYVYDIVSHGPRRKELGWYLDRDQIRRVAFRRPRPDLADHIPSVIRFCQQVYHNKVPFDRRFRLGDDTYYCSEFIDTAWRRQNVPLCAPVPINQLPNFTEFPKTTVTLIEAMTSISAEQEVILPGNDSFGIWSSPALTLLLPERSPEHVPISTAGRRTESPDP